MNRLGLCQVLSLRPEGRYRAILRLIFANSHGFLSTEVWVEIENGVAIDTIPEEKTRQVNFLQSSFL